MRLLPFLLAGRALQWFHSQPDATLATWGCATQGVSKEVFAAGKDQFATEQDL
uniref:Uncharacterized protein n=1 Tax=Arundo donax TaxID=35708 RepID=A0A0A9ABZ1_ARUDO